MRALRIFFLFLLLISFLPGCFLNGGNDEDKDADIPADYIISAGYKSGNYNKFSKGFVYAMDKAWAKRVELMESEGSYENLQNLIRGKADFAVAQEDVIEKIRNNPSGKEDIEISSSIEVICVGYLETVHLLVNTNNVIPANDTNGDGIIGIEDIAVSDLQNKIVNTGSVDSGSYVTAINVLTANNVTYTAMAKSSKDAVSEVVAGTMDATFYTTGLPNAVFEKIDKNAPVTLIRVTYPFTTSTYAYDRISWLDYPFQKFDVTDTLHVRSLLVTTKKMKLPDIDTLFRFLSLDEESSDFDVAADYAEYETASTQVYLSHKYSELWSNFSLFDTRDFFINNPELVNDEAVLNLFPSVEITENPVAHFITGSATGSYSKIADDLLLLVNDKGTAYLQLTKQPSSGSFENITSIYNGQSSVAVVQDDLFNYLKNTLSDHESLKVWSARKIVPLYKEYVHLIVNKAARAALLNEDGDVQRDAATGKVVRHETQTIESVADLKGLNVCLCEKTSGSFISGITLLKTYGFSQKNAPTYYFSTPEIAAVKVASGEYDALVKVTAEGYSLLTDTVIPVYDGGIQSAGLDEGELAAAGYLGAAGTTADERKANFTKELFFEKIKLIPCVKNPLSSAAYTTGIISYPGISENIETSYVRAILIAHPAFNDDEAGKLIDSIYANKESLTAIISSKSCINKEEALEYFKKNPYNWSEKSKSYFLKAIAGRSPDGSLTEAAR